jgi:L-fuconolactonase
MPVRADAHAHLFKPGFVAELPPSCRRTEPDEVTLYDATRHLYGVDQLLAVGYEGSEWAAGNNAYLARVAAGRPWVRPVAYVHYPARLTVGMLESWRREGFVGLSLYVFADETARAVSEMAPELSAWLSDHRWLVSVNSRGAMWAAWQSVLSARPELRLVVSHLGLPPAAAQPPAASGAREALRDVTDLARFPGVRVKLSGFYALAAPGYEYPHRPAWPYVEEVLAAFGPERLLWGSDFSPSLEWVSFPQTFALFEHMPFLSAADRERIEGSNLVGLLSEVDTVGGGQPRTESPSA